MNGEVMWGGRGGTVRESEDRLHGLLQEERDKVCDDRGVYGGAEPQAKNQKVVCRIGLQGKQDNEEAVVEKGDHKSPNECLLRPNTEGLSLVDCEYPDKESDEGFYEHMDAPCTVHCIHCKSQCKSNQRGPLSTLV